MPIDNIKIELFKGVKHLILNRREPFELANLTFSPKYSTKGEIYAFIAELRNLRISLQLGFDRCIIENSLHKYLHNSNHSDFNLSELQSVIEELSDLLHIDVSKGIIKKVECGCNILVDDAESAWQQFISYRGKLFQPQIYHGKAFGANCYFNQYIIKAYNKSAERSVRGVPVPENLFRWELRVEKAAMLIKRSQPIPVTTVADLIDPLKLQYLCNDVVEKYYQSVKQKQLSVNGCCLSELTAIARQTEPGIKEAIRKLKPYTFLRDARLVKDIVKRCKMGDELGPKIKNKFRDLING